MNVKEFAETDLFIVDSETYYWTIWTLKKGGHSLDSCNCCTKFAQSTEYRQDVVIAYKKGYNSPSELEKYHFRDLVLNIFNTVLL